jgi:stress response protein YsnF
MTITVIGLYDSADKAQQAIGDLTKAGFDKNSVELLRSDGPAGDAIAGKLTDHGIEQREAQLYAEAVRRGGVLVDFQAPDEKAENAVSILDRHGARNLDNLAAELGQGRQQQADERETLPVIEEQVSVGKRRVLRGGVRLTSTVTERPVEETVRLREEKVNVERRPADRELSPEEVDKAFQQKTVDLTETGEEVVVTKEARVVEEVSLRKSAEEREEKVQATARRTDVKVEDVEPHQRSKGQG